MPAACRWRSMMHIGPTEAFRWLGIEPTSSCKQRPRSCDCMGQTQAMPCHGLGLYTASRGMNGGLSYGPWGSRVKSQDPSAKKLSREPGGVMLLSSSLRRATACAAQCLRAMPPTSSTTHGCHGIGHARAMSSAPSGSQVRVVGSTAVRRTRANDFAIVKPHSRNRLTREHVKQNPVRCGQQ